VPNDYSSAEVAGYTPPDPEEGAEEAPPPPGAPVEDAGDAKGCNQFTYFATNDPAGSWTVLPNVTPQQIVSSKRIRKYLTGDLTADVRAYPPFPGQEKEYLRALIARIVAATTLCPVGKFEVAEEGAEPTPVDTEGDEGRKPPAASALGSVKGWCTRYMGILDIGRCSNIPIEDEEDEEGNIKPKPYQQPETPFLSPVSDAEWTATTYCHGGPEVAMARSLKWPGALCAYQLGKGSLESIASLYIGYGQEMLAAPFVMEAPPPFETEPEEVHEQADLPLDEENKKVLADAQAALEEEVANLPDEAAEE